MINGRLALAIVTLLLACSSPSARMGQSTAPAAEAAAASRVLVMAIRSEPVDLSLKTISLSASVTSKRAFNASLALVDGNGVARPYLAEALPALHTNDWQVFADGRMQTTYHLRDGLSWHDGQPLTAGDFVFAWQVYAAPLASVFTPTPQDQIDDVRATDPRTLLVRWRTPYAEAGVLPDGALDPLPRHILQESFALAQADPVVMASFLANAFWTTEYVGSGPFMLKRWDPGTTIEAEAFTGHVLGRPKIDRLRMQIMSDENTVLTSVLSGNLDLAPRLTLRFEHGEVLKQDWVPAGHGNVIYTLSTSGQYVAFQQRPEFVRPSGLLDVRVRRALVYALDRHAISDALFDGESPMLDTFISPRAAIFPRVDSAIAKYPYDPRQAERLFTEVGMTKGEDGLFTDGTGGQFRADIVMSSGTLNDRAALIIVDTWKKAGISSQSSALSAAQGRLPEARIGYPGLASVGSVLAALPNFSSAQIGTAANRWVGLNRGGWANPEYDRLWTQYNNTLEQADRDQRVVDMARVLSEEVPGIPLFANIDVWAFKTAVRGIVPGASEYTYFWNIHQWELQ